MAMKQEVNVPLIVTIGAVSSILLVVIVIGASAWYLRTSEEITAQNFELYPDETTLAVQNTQATQLTAPAHWMDTGHTTAAIPIDVAMQLVVANHGKVRLAAPPSAPAPPARAASPAPAAAPAGQ